MKQKNLVLKFGGTSMADLSAMQRAKDIIEKTDGALLIVVSATAGTTEQLISIWNHLLVDEVEKAQEVTANIRKRHEAMLVLPFHEERYAWIQKFIQEKDLSPANYHELLSIGEDLSSSIFAHFLGSNASWVDARQLIITDDASVAANVNQRESNLRMLQLLEKSKHLPDLLYVTQGFVGSSQISGQTTTLGRGGSDYSAAIMAAGLESSELQIWTDVPGIFSLDPKIEPKARVVEEFNFFEAAQLAQLGAKVLHPLTLIPTMPKNIPVVIKSTYQPELIGSRVSSREEKEDAAKLKSIAIRKGQALLTIKSLKRPESVGHLARIFSLLGEHKISIDHVTTSEISTSFSFAQSYKVTPTLMGELEVLGQVIYQDKLGLLSLIGHNIATHPEILSSALGLLPPFQLRSLFLGPLDEYISFMLPEEHLEETARILHRQLILNSEKKELL